MNFEIKKDKDGSWKGRLTSRFEQTDWHGGFDSYASCKSFLEDEYADLLVESFPEQDDDPVCDWDG